MATLPFLGTSSALPTVDRTNTILAVTGQTPGRGLLIDCGGAVYTRLEQAHIAPDALADLFITHAHIDHIGSLPSLIESWRLAGRTAPLRIIAIPEVLAVARALIATFSFELTLDRWSFDITFHPVENGQALRLGGIGLVDDRLRRQLGVPWSRSDELQFRAMGALSRGLSPLMPERLKVMGPAQLRWRRKAIATGPLGAAGQIAA